MTTGRPRVFITQPVAERAVRRLEPRAEVLGNPDPLRVLTKPELIAAVRDVDYLFCLVADHVPAPALLALDSVVMTPHVGSAVVELRERMADVVVDNILALIEGRRPPNCINPEIYG